MSKVLFPVKPKYELRQEDEHTVLVHIMQVLNNDTKLNITTYERISQGQNIIYRLHSNSTDTSYLLKIVSRDGYPCIDTLESCYKELEKHDIVCPKLLYYDRANTVVPYGYTVSSWIEGSVESFDSRDWIREFAKQLNNVHSIKMNHFGYLNNGPKYRSLLEYFNHMDDVIDHSFGQIFESDNSIWDLETYKLVTPGFLEKTFKRIKELASRIKIEPTPVLLHGDMFPKNLIKTRNGAALIDWDETRSGWWVYEIARTLFYIDDWSLLDSFLEIYNHQDTREDVLIGIRLEHIRQLLRKLMMASFNTTNCEQTRNRIRLIEIEIEKKIELPLY